jgi:cyclase
MKKILAFIIILLINDIHAQDLPSIKHIKLTDSIYLISYSEIPKTTINALVYVTKHGLLLVDALASSTVDVMKSEIAKISSKPITKIINTHSHQDHTGGDIELGKNATFFGHSNLGKRLKSGSLLFNEFPDYCLPTYTTDSSMSLFFDNEEVKIIAFVGCHDDCDVAVYFSKSKVVCLGDMFYGNKFPSVDWMNGDVLLYPECIQRAINIFPDDAVFIPGHGNALSKKDLKEYYQMLVTTIHLVKQGIADGKSVETVQKEKVLKKWESFDNGYISADEWIEYIAYWLQPEKQKKSIMEELYYSLKEKGVAGAIDRITRYKQIEKDTYMFNEGSMYRLVNYVITKRSADDAIRICEFYVKEFPESTVALTVLAEVYLTNSFKEKAKECIQNLIKIDPNNTYAKEKLQELN